MDLKNLKKELQKLATSKGSDPSKTEITPYRDWRIVVIGFFVGIAASFGFNIYMSIEINRDSFFSGAPTPTQGTLFNREGLARVLNNLSQKEAVFERVKIEGVHVVDPSL